MRERESERERGKGHVDFSIVRTSRAFVGNGVADPGCSIDRHESEKRERERASERERERQENQYAHRRRVEKKKESNTHLLRLQLVERRRAKE